MQILDQQQTDYKLPSKPSRSQNISKYFQLMKFSSNHYEIKFLKNLHLQLYSITFVNELPKEQQNELIMHVSSSAQFLRKNGINRFWISGYNLWSFDFVEKPFQVPGCKQLQNINLLIKHVKTYNLTQNLDLIPHESLKQAMNAILSQIYQERNLKQIFRKGQFFDKDKIEKINDVQILQGFTSVLQMGQSSPLLLIDFKTKVFNKQTVLHFIKENKKSKNPVDLQTFFENKTFMTIYSKRMYRIKSIDFKSNPTSKMESLNVSYEQYYYQRYKITLSDLTQPLLVHEDKKTKQSIRLIPELLYMIELTNAQKNNFKVMNNIKLQTTLDPLERSNKIDNERTLLDKYFSNHSISISNNSATPAYKIVKPTLLPEASIKQTDGACFNIRGKLIEQSNINNWILIHYNEEQQIASLFTQEFIKATKELGNQISPPRKIVMNNLDPAAWSQALLNNFNTNGKPQIVVSILDRHEDSKLYNELKKFLISVQGVLHQNVAIQTVDSKKFSKIAQQIVKQVHSKIGKQLWNIQKITEISERIMIIGIDVYHKTLANNKSCVGFNAQFGQQSEKHFTKTIIVEKGKELNKGVGQLLNLSLQQYQKQNKQYPDTIVIFRDGVGNSQINDLIEIELNTMKSVIQQTYNIKLPQFAYIIVNKRISDKFFSSNNENNGMIFPERVTYKEFDFFLIAQQVNQGTPIPTHYTVIENTTNWNEDTFWRFTYFQCFNYRNWSGPVKIPACLQNAHTVAYRVGEVIQSDAHASLESLLYFL
ncbi:unnamed protein product [Paramecium octaurelia]|uniref:Uncharacterized protein n=1 Tax=Paramecium octaurelia TaxID=43137 RepID=A0A8S1TW75_PAROT|nr:unnamed protein product [Paramecium octaurelia]